MILHIEVDIPDFSFAKVREMKEQIEEIFQGYAIKVTVEDPYDVDEDDEDVEEDEKYYEDEEDEDF